MAKLVINTQLQENYGAHTWLGDGECPQYWKFKGGNTYVLENLSDACVKRILENGIPTLDKTITKRDDYWAEYILDWSIEDDDKVVCEEWESPCLLQFTDGKWMFEYTNHWGRTSKFELGTTI